MRRAWRPWNEMKIKCIILFITLIQGDRKDQLFSSLPKMGFRCFLWFMGFLCTIKTDIKKWHIVKFLYYFAENVELSSTQNCVLNSLVYMYCWWFSDKSRSSQVYLEACHLISKGHSLLNMVLSTISGLRLFKSIY